MDQHGFARLWLLEEVDRHLQLLFMPKSRAELKICCERGCFKYVSRKATVSMRRRDNAVGWTVEFKREAKCGRGQRQEVGARWLERPMIPGEH